MAMNETINTILNRKSVRAYKDEPISHNQKQIILDAALRAPTAGNMMLYTIIEVTREKTKQILAKTCDHQPFIAKAPLVLLFLADYQRWMDYFDVCEIEAFCRKEGLPRKQPQQGDLFLACCDALIAAQTAVIAAQSLGIGSCYIGDIMENYEAHKELFDLPRFVFPITLVCFGRPTPSQEKRPLSTRFDAQYIHFTDTYHRLGKSDFESMVAGRQRQIFGNRTQVNQAVNLGQYLYKKKFTADFSAEMNRSVKKIVDVWVGEGENH